MQLQWQVVKSDEAHIFISPLPPKPTPTHFYWTTSHFYCSISN